MDKKNNGDSFYVECTEIINDNSLGIFTTREEIIKLVNLTHPNSKLTFRKSMIEKIIKLLAENCSTLTQSTRVNGYPSMFSEC